jgi:hypothetical protein
MEPTTMSTTVAHTDPLHQYAVPMQVQPVNYPVQATVKTSEVLAAGIFGLIVAGTGTMGANLHKVNDGKMTMGEAMGNSLVKGAAGGIAAASATAASTTFTSGGAAGLAVTLAAATGVSYLLSNERNCLVCAKK